VSRGTKVLIVAVGSRGDVAPVTGVGARLYQASYDAPNCCGLPSSSSAT
jgi:hypothetical protein